MNAGIQQVAKQFPFYFTPVTTGLKGKSYPLCGDKSVKINWKIRKVVNPTLAMADWETGARWDISPFDCTEEGKPHLPGDAVPIGCVRTFRLAKEMFKLAAHPRAGWLVGAVVMLDRWAALNKLELTINELRQIARAYRERRKYFKGKGGLSNDNACRYYMGEVVERIGITWDAIERIDMERLLQLDSAIESALRETCLLPAVPISG